MSLETLPPQAAPVNPRSALLSNVVALLRVLPRGGRPGALWRRIYRHPSIRGWGHLRARYAYVADGDTAVGPFIEVAVQVGVGRQFGGAGRKKGGEPVLLPSHPAFVVDSKGFEAHYTRSHTLAAVCSKIKVGFGRQEAGNIMPYPSSNT